MSSRIIKSESTQTENSSQENISLHYSKDDAVIMSSITKSVTTFKSVSDEKPCATSKSLGDEEKELLAQFNDVFASKIAHSLDNVKKKLNNMIQSISHVETSDYHKIRKVYEDKLRYLRIMVKQQEPKRTNLDIESNNFQDEASSFRNYLERRNKLERILSKQRCDSERYSLLVTPHDNAEKRVAKLRKDSDAEIPWRMDIENQNVTLKEQLERSHFVIEEEISDIKHAEYDLRLAEEFRAIREETADEFENSFILRLEEFKKNNQKSNESAIEARGEVVSCRSKVDSLEQNLASKTADVLSKRVKDLESLLSSERNEFDEQLKRLHNESDQLRADLQIRLDEFSNLMSTKIALDQEIYMYRKLLESEEAFSNLSIKATAETSLSVMSSHAGVKRQSVDDYSELVSGDVDNGANIITCGRDSFKINLVTSGDIEFNDKPDCTDKFVKIHNRSDKVGNVHMPHGSIGSLTPARKVQDPVQGSVNSYICEDALISLYSGESDSYTIPPQPQPVNNCEVPIYVLRNNMNSFYQDLRVAAVDNVAAGNLPAAPNDGQDNNEDLSEDDLNDLNEGPLNGPIVEGVGANRYKCFYCGQAFRTFRLIKLHIINTHGGTLCSNRHKLYCRGGRKHCEGCGMTFQCQHWFRAHLGLRRQCQRAFAK